MAFQREASVLFATKKTSTGDRGGAHSDQLVIPEPAICSGSSDSDQEEHAQDDERGMMLLSGRELKNPRDTNVAGDVERAQ